MTLLAPAASPAPPERPEPARHPWWPALLPAGLLAVLGGLLVQRRQDLWYDELYTAEVGTAGLPALAEAVWSGTGTTPFLADAPPSYNAPYYVVVHLWLAVTRLPADDVGLRLLSLLAAVAAVLVLARAAQRLAGSGVALATGLLAATSPLVVEHSAEARMYALALLAVATTLLGLARWLDGAPRGLLLLTVGAVGAGLAHWFALPVVAGLVLAALALRGRAALPVVGVGVLAALPPLVLVALAARNGTGSSMARWIRPADGTVPHLALQAWTGDRPWLLAAVLAALASAAVVAARRPAVRPLALVALCWTAVPLLLVQAVELVRPVFVPRYLLPALLGVAVLGALGAAGWRRAVAVPAVGLLVAGSVAASLPLLDREVREDGRGAVAALEAQRAAEDAVVAVDDRAALALRHHGPAALRASALLPPDDPPPGADVVWLLRHATADGVRPSDDDAVLAAQGLRVVETRLFPGTAGDLVLQRWER